MPPIRRPRSDRDGASASRAEAAEGILARAGGLGHRPFARSYAVAPHGAAGLQMAREHTPDAILLDMMMPDLHGLEVFERLQADAATKDIPVVLVTALMNVAGTKPAWEGYPLHGVIPKPYDPMTLCDQIREHVGWS